MTDRIDMAEATPTNRAFAILRWTVVPVVILILLSLSPRPVLSDLANAWFTSGIAGGAILAFWLVAAWGYGAVVQRWLVPDLEHVGSIRFAAGVAILLWLDGSIARLGLLDGAGLWFVTGIGMALAAWAVRWPEDRAVQTRPAPDWLPVWGVVAGPALALLMVAVTVVPGNIWLATEFGGYDVLSYHLQLPREWFVAGRMSGLEHNVYSYLPSAGEAAYLHLLTHAGGTHASAIAAQSLHACMVIAAALTAGRLIGGRRGPLAAITAATIVVATPWAVVVGSLAYNEGFVLLMLAGALVVVDASNAHRPRHGLLIGLLAGTACAAKLTAVGFVAIPLAVVLLPMIWRRRAIGFVAAGGVGFMFALAPWLVSNAMQIGQPCFPFLTEWFGPAHWSADQVARWNAAHHAAPDLTALWTQFLAFGVGANPQPGSAWAWQWSIVPWLMLAAIVFGLRARDQRGDVIRWSVIALVQLTFWFVATHQQSRFLLPILIPAALLIARVIPRAETPHLRLSIHLALIAFSCVVVVLFARENARPDARALLSIGREHDFDGTTSAQRFTEAPTDAARQRVAEEAPLSFWVNRLYPERARVLSIGEAAPYWFRVDRLDYQTTWDDGPWSRILRETQEPRAVVERLRAEGYTHVLVNGLMLDIWAQSGWNDPLTRRDVVLGTLERGGARADRIIPPSMYLLRLPSDPR